MADSGNNAIRLIQTAPTGGLPTIAAIANGASNQTGAVAGGEIMVVFGSGLGPAQLVAAPGSSPRAAATIERRDRAGEWNARIADLRFGDPVIGDYSQRRYGSECAGGGAVSGPEQRAGDDSADGGFAGALHGELQRLRDRRWRSMPMAPPTAHRIRRPKAAC